MAQMIVEVGGKEYTFELNREEIVRSSSLGLDMSRLRVNPLEQMVILWTVGLHKNHPQLSLTLCSKLFDKYAYEEEGDMQEVIEFLSGQYQAFSLATQTGSNTKKKGRIIE